MTGDKHIIISIKYTGICGKINNSCHYIYTYIVTITHTDTIYTVNA